MSEDNGQKVLTILRGTIVDSANTKMRMTTLRNLITDRGCKLNFKVFPSLKGGVDVLGITTTL